MDDTVTFCFHGIGTPGRDLEPDEDGYWVRTDRFHRILDHLAERSGPRITFDDGNASDAEIALPALTERGLTATFFILAGRLDTPGSLTSAAVAELRRAGMTIGTHGMNHRIWRGMTPQTRQVELIDARDRIAEAAGAAVDEAACPLGGYDRRLLNDLRGLGYTRVHTSDHLPSRPDRWLQPRFSVLAGDDPDSLTARVHANLAFPRTLLSRASAAVKRRR